MLSMQMPKINNPIPQATREKPVDRELIMKGQLDITQKGHTKTRNKNYNDRGFTLIEILITMAILAVGILGVMAMQITATKSNTQARKVTESAAWAADEFERLLSLDYEDPSLDDGITVTPAQSMLNNTNIPSNTYLGPYSVSYTVDENNPIENVKRIDVTVFWNDGSGRSLTFPYYKGRTL